MEPHFRCQGRLRNKAHPDSYRENKHPAILRDENLCFYLPMWFKKTIGLVILIVT